MKTLRFILVGILSMMILIGCKKDPDPGPVIHDTALLTLINGFSTSIYQIPTVDNYIEYDIDGTEGAIYYGEEVTLKVYPTSNKVHYKLSFYYQDCINTKIPYGTTLEGDLDFTDAQMTIVVEEKDFDISGCDNVGLLHYTLTGMPASAEVGTGDYYDFAFASDTVSLVNALDCSPYTTRSDGDITFEAVKFLIDPTLPCYFCIYKTEYDAQSGEYLDSDLIYTRKILVEACQVNDFEYSGN
jgi:hypothetical protein